MSNYETIRQLVGLPRYEILGEQVVAITHGVRTDQLHYILEHEEIVPSRYWRITSLSINGYFNLFAYRDAILVFDFEMLMEKYHLSPVFYVPYIEEELRLENYGLSPLNLFWEMEVFTRQRISIYDVSEVIVVEEGGAIAVPSEIIEKLETYMIPTRIGSREDAFFGENATTVRYLLHLMRLANYPSLRVQEPPKEVLQVVDKMNRDVARIFGLQDVYEHKIRPEYIRV